MVQRVEVETMIGIVITLLSILIWLIPAAIDEYKRNHRI